MSQNLGAEFCFCIYVYYIVSFLLFIILEENLGSAANFYKVKCSCFEYTSQGGMDNTKNPAKKHHPYR